jgi:hypothetical protein
MEKIQSRGVSFEDVEKFFIEFRFRVFIFDVNMKCRASYIPDKEQSSLSVHFYFVAHNGHLYRMNNIHSLKHDPLGRVVSLKNDYVEDGLSGKFCIPEKKQSSDVVMIHSVADAVRLVLSSQEKISLPDKDAKAIDAVLSEDVLANIAISLKRDHGIEARLSLSSRFSISQLYCGRVSFRCIDSEHGGMVSFQDASECKYRMDRYSWFKLRLFQREWKSVYNDSVFALLNNYKPSPLAMAFQANEKSNQRCIKWDFTKFYTGILINHIKHFPSINGFDDFQKYQGEGLEDTCIYMVRKLGDDVGYIMKRFALTYGVNLKQYQAGYEILQVLKPSHLTINHISRFTQKIFKDRKLAPKEGEEDFRKWVLNSCIGTLSKSNSKACRGVLLTDLDEASHFVNEQGGGVRRIIPGVVEEGAEEEQDTGLYVHYNETVKKLRDGFLPMGHLIVDTGARLLMDLKADLESVGLVSLYSAVDCICTDHDETKMRIFQHKFADKYFYGTHGDEWSKIGSLKVEVCDTTNIRKKVGCVLENACLEPAEKQPGQEIFVEDEYNLGPVVEARNRLAFEGILPGTGKTYAAKEYAREHKTLFVVPNNQKRSELIMEGFDAVTVDTLLGFRMGDGDEFEQDKERKSLVIRPDEDPVNIFEYKVICFDELLLNNIDHLWAIDVFCRKHEGKFKFLFNYDVYQNQPVGERLDAVKNLRQYKLDIVRKMAGSYVILRRMKRFDCSEEERPKVQAFFERLLGFVQANDKQGLIDFCLQNGKSINYIQDIKTGLNIAYMNHTCRKVNDIIHPLKEWGVGETVIYSSRQSFVRVGNRTHRFYKNDRYDTIRTTEKTLELRHVLGKTFELPISIVKSHFKLPFCMTGHSSQGFTISDDYTIVLDAPYLIDCEWLYTAITRCKRWEQITFCFNKQHAKDTERAIWREFEYQISGHIQSDLEAGRLIDSMDEYVDADWCMEQIKSTCGICAGEYDLHGQDAFSIDRINNDVAHIKSNCRVICRNCNISKK